MKGFFFFFSEEVIAILLHDCFGRYYEGGISSVYMWEDDNEGFVACFLIKKGKLACNLA